jgi:aminoglycoside phosphotransferase family enzyme
MLKKLEKNKKFTFLKSGEVIEFSILQHYDNFEKIKSYMDSELDKQQLERIEMWKSNINKRDNLFNMDDEGNFK